MNSTMRAKEELLRYFAGAKDGKGYTRSPQENLLSGIDLATVKGDLERGDGNEVSIPRQSRGL